MVLSQDLEPAEYAEDGVTFDDDGAESEADLGLNFADGAGDGFELAGLRQRLHGAEVEQDVEKIETSRVGSQFFEMRHYLRQGDGSSTLRANPAFFGVTPCLGPPPGQTEILENMDGARRRKPDLRPVVSY